MACIQCQQSAFTVALNPCGHCLCDPCSAPVDLNGVCPHCGHAATCILKVYFAGTPVASEPPPDPPAPSLAEPVASQPAYGGLLCLKDAAEAQLDLLREVEGIELTIAEVSSSRDLELEEIMALLGVTLSDEVVEMRLSNPAEYIRLLLNEVGHCWRRFALRMHPDKVKASDHSFWDDERAGRSTTVFKYVSDAHDHLVEGLTAYLVKVLCPPPPVKAVREGKPNRGQFGHFRKEERISNKYRSS